MRFGCESCGAQYMIADEKVGKVGVKVRCKKCSEVIIVRQTDDDDLEQATIVIDNPLGDGGDIAAQLGLNQQTGDSAEKEIGEAFNSVFDEGGVSSDSDDSGEDTGSFSEQSVSEASGEEWQAGEDSPTLDYGISGEWNNEGPEGYEGQGIGESGDEAGSEFRKEDPGETLAEGMSSDDWNQEADSDVFESAVSDLSGQYKESTDQFAAAMDSAFDAALDSGSVELEDDSGDYEATRVFSTEDILRVAEEKGHASQSVYEEGADDFEDEDSEVSVVSEIGYDDSSGEKKQEEESPSEWYVAIDDERVGPVTIEEVQSHAEFGNLNRESLVWKQGFADWTPLHEVEEMEHILDLIPQSASESEAEEEADLESDNFKEEESDDGYEAWKPAAASLLASLAAEELSALGTDSRGGTGTSASPLKDSHFSGGGTGNFPQVSPSGTFSLASALGGIENELAEPGASPDVPESMVQKDHDVSGEKQPPFISRPRFGNAPPNISSTLSAPAPVTKTLGLQTVTLSDQLSSSPLKKSGGQFGKGVSRPVTSSPRPMGLHPKLKWAIGLGGGGLSATVLFLALIVTGVIGGKTPDSSELHMPQPIKQVSDEAPLVSDEEARVEEAAPEESAVPDDTKAEAEPEKAEEPKIKAAPDSPAAKKAPVRKRTAPRKARPARKSSTPARKQASASQPAPPPPEPEPPPAPAPKAAAEPPPREEPRKRVELLPSAGDEEEDLEAALFGKSASGPSSRDRGHTGKSTEESRRDDTSKQARPSRYIPTDTGVRERTLPTALSRADIMNVVRGKQRELGNCVQQARTLDPRNVSTTVVMVWTVEPDGRPTGIQPKFDVNRGTPLVQCLTQVIASMRFPPYGGPRMDPIEFPFQM